MASVALVILPLALQACAAQPSPPPRLVLAEAVPASAATTNAAGAAGAASAPSTEPTAQTNAEPSYAPSSGQSSSSPPARGMGRTWGFITLAVGAEAAAVAIVSSFLVLREDVIRGNGCNAQNVCSHAALDANTKIDGLLGWNTAAWVAAAVGLSAGAYLVITNPADAPYAPRTTAIGVGPNGSGVGLNMQGTF